MWCVLLLLPETQTGRCMCRVCMCQPVPAAGAALKEPSLCSCRGACHARILIAATADAMHAVNRADSWCGCALHDMGLC